MKWMMFVSCLSLFAISPAPAQHPSAGDSARILILSGRVGTVISREEAKHFHLFSQFAGFASAVVLELPDSTFAVWCTIDTGAESRDTLVPYNNATIAVLAEKIEHFEEIEQGEYLLGSRPTAVNATREYVPLPRGVVLPGTARASVAGRSHGAGRIRLADSTGVLVVVPVRGRVSDNIPLARMPGLQMPRVYPVFGCGIGLRTISPDLSGLAGVVGSNPGVTPAPMFEILPEVLLTEEIGIQCNAAYLWGGATDQHCTTWGASLVLYAHPFADQDWRPFLEGGYLRVSLSGLVSNVKYSAGDGGFRVGAGVEYILGVTTALVIDVCYEGIGELSSPMVDYRSAGTGVYSEVQVPVSVNLSSVQFGARIKF